MKELITDWSGVAQNDIPPVYNANMECLRHYGKPTMSLNEWKRKSKLTIQEFLHSQGVSDDSQTMSNLYHRFFKESLKKGIKPQILPGVSETLGILHQRLKKIAVLSSHPEDLLLNEAKEYGISKYLDEIRGSTKDKVAGLKQLSRDCEKPAYIGDTTYDISAAKEAGVESIAICTGYHFKDMLEKEKPHILLESFSQLIDLAD